MCSLIGKTTDPLVTYYETLNCNSHCELHEYENDKNLYAK
jgi:hypothetical protein